MRALAAFFFVGLFAFAAHAQAEKPKVGFYSEGLCPYCRKYLAKTLMPLYESGLLDYVDFKMYPSGNARWRYNETSGEMYIHCQHGDSECVINRILNCGIEHSDGMEWLPYAACVEESGKAILNEPYKLHACASENSIDAETIDECYKGPEGQQLFKKAFDATAALKVPHKWVPWIVFDDIPLFDAELTLPTIICISIPNEERPEQCYKNPYNGLQGRAMNNAVGSSFFASKEKDGDSARISIH